jgi:hypothetical protein
MNDIQRDILLYWSGEADETTIRRVRERLERDPGARSYLNELQEIDIEFKSGKITGDCGVPARRKGLLDEVLNEAVQEQQPTKYFEQPKSWWSSLAITSTVAAALMVLAAGHYLFMHVNNPTQEISNSQLSSNQEEADEFPHVDRMTLSKRLLEPSVSFRRNGDGLVLMRSHRARQHKIRTTPYKP